MSSPAQQDWYQRNKDRLAAERQAIRRSVLELYGAECACCGETSQEFLTIGHPNGDGGRERNERRVRGNAYYRILLNEPRRDDLRCECWNCNMAHGFYGACPHERILA